jgi:hypothetical protein
MNMLGILLTASTLLTTAEGSEPTRSERVHEAFNNLRSDNLEILDGFYHPEVRFSDPLADIEGIDRVKDYYARMYANVQEIRFEFNDEYVAGDVHTFTWTLHLKAKGLNRGKPYTVDGVSIIEFGKDDLVVRHRDFLDIGALVYERAPIVRFFVKRAKNRLEPEPSK